MAHSGEEAALRGARFFRTLRRLGEPVDQMRAVGGQEQQGGHDRERHRRRQRLPHRRHGIDDGEAGDAQDRVADERRQAEAETVTDRDREIQNEQRNAEAAGDDHRIRDGGDVRHVSRHAARDRRRTGVACEQIQQQREHDEAAARHPVDQRRVEAAEQPAEDEVRDDESGVEKPDRRMTAFAAEIVQGIRRSTRRERAQPLQERRRPGRTRAGIDRTVVRLRGSAAPPDEVREQREQCERRRHGQRERRERIPGRRPGENQSETGEPEGTAQDQRPAAETQAVSQRDYEVEHEQRDTGRPEGDHAVGDDADVGDKHYQATRARGRCCTMRAPESRQSRNYKGEKDGKPHRIAGDWLGDEMTDAEVGEDQDRAGEALPCLPPFGFECARRRESGRKGAQDSGEGCPVRNPPLPACLAGVRGRLFRPCRDLRHFSPCSRRTAGQEGVLSVRNKANIVPFVGARLPSGA